MSFLSSLSKFLDDDILDDLREVGKEFTALKDDVVASVKEVSVDAQELAQTAKENTTEITKVISDFKRPNSTK